MLKEQLSHKIDFKTKPVGALGVLEQLAFQIGCVQNTLTPTLTDPTMLIFAADHGIAQAGVSAYPPEVTHQMVLNFLNGGAAINVFCKQHGISLQIIDAGVNFDFEPHPSLIDAKIAHGSRNFLNEPAMTAAQMEACLTAGAAVVATTKGNVIGFGEMGIGNTSAAALLMSVLCHLPIETCVGRGTGLTDAQLSHKIATLTQAQQTHAPIQTPQEALQCFGGFEIAQMTGAMLAAFADNRLLLIDGFIASSAFLVAFKINPDILQNAVFCHLSDEQAHAKMLDHLGVKPILSLNMRLGEGTGCAVAYPILQSAVLFLNEMASFESANVSTQSQ